MELQSYGPIDRLNVELENMTPTPNDQTATIKPWHFLVGVAAIAIICFGIWKVKQSQRKASNEEK